jgi:hypothetical protein
MNTNPFILLSNSLWRGTLPQYSGLFLLIAAVLSSGASMSCFAVEAATKNLCPAHIICKRIDDTQHAHNIDHGNVLMGSDGLSDEKCSYFEESKVNDSDPDSLEKSAHAFYDPTSRKFLYGANGLVCPASLSD